jgi:hypothetical protein
MLYFRNFTGAEKEIRNLRVTNSVEMFAILDDINGEMAGRSVNLVYITKIWEQMICSKTLLSCTQ